MTCQLFSLPPTTIHLISNLFLLNSVQMYKILGILHHVSHARINMHTLHNHGEYTTNSSHLGLNFEPKSSRHQSNVLETVHTILVGQIQPGSGIFSSILIYRNIALGTSSLNLLQHNVTEIYKWFRTLSLEHPSTVTVNVSIGKTYFERDIMAVHITDRSVNGHKPKIYLQCLLHASMYVSTF